MSGEKPVDLRELAREAGVAEAKERAQQSRSDSVQLVTFNPNRDHGREIPVGRHPLTNYAVFPDMKRLGARIKAGETYFCDLVEYHPAVGSPVYYANPIAKVDASFLFDLHPGQVDRLLDSLLLGSQASLLNQARAKIQVEAARSVKPQLETLTTERDSLRVENQQLKAALQKAPQIAAPNQVSPGAVTHVMQPESSAPMTVNPNEIAQSTTSRSIDRPGANDLQSPLIQEGHYFVHVAPNRKRLFIHRHAEGNLISAGSKLEVPGLSVLRPFDGPEKLNASFDSRVGGLIVDLTRREP